MLSGFKYHLSAKAFRRKLSGWLPAQPIGKGGCFTAVYHTYKLVPSCRSAVITCADRYLIIRFKVPCAFLETPASRIKKLQKKKTKTTKTPKVTFLFLHFKYIKTLKVGGKECTLKKDGPQPEHKWKTTKKNAVGIILVSYECLQSPFHDILSN